MGFLTENFDRRRVPIKSKDRAKMQGPYPYYGASGVIDSVNDYLFDGAYLLISEDGNLLSQSSRIAFVARGKFWVNNHAHVVKPMGSVPLGYLEAYANHMNLQGYVMGTTRPKLTQAALNRIPVPLPPLPEQHRIVAEIEKQLTRLDASVAALERVRANLKRYRASVLKTACEGRLVPTEAELARVENRDYEPAGRLLQRILAERRARWHSQPKRRRKYKDPAPPDTSNLPEPPCGWRYCSIESLLSLERSGMRTGPFGSLLKKHEHRESGVQVFGIENVRKMEFVPGNKIFVTAKKAQELAGYDVKAGDVLISRSGTVGEVCVVPEGLGEARLSTNLMRLNFAQECILPRYFCLLFNGSPTVLGQIVELCSGSTRDFLNRKIIQSLVFPLPPLTEQHRIVAEVERRLSVIQQAEAVVEASLKRAGRLRQSILKQAFSGKLVPQDPTDEPASALLERIRAERATAETAAKRQREPRRRKSRRAPAGQLSLS